MGTHLRAQAVKLKFSLHAAQQQIYNSPARFTVNACGRQFGKTYLAVVRCIVEGLKTHNTYGDLLSTDAEVVYIGVTLEQARRNVWHLLKNLALPVAMKGSDGRPMIHENQSTVTLVNGVRIRLLGMDNPDAARGMRLRFAVFDEYAQMPEMAFPEIVRPALLSTRGGAMFIGTPKGRNHFYKLFMAAQKGELGPEWAAFNFSSFENSFLSKDELIQTAKDLTRGTEHLQLQEIQASFVEPGGDIFRRDWFKIDSQEPPDGEWFVAVDLAGFTTDEVDKTPKRRDYSAIAVVKVFPTDSSGKSYDSYGWWVRKIVYGRWDVRTTAYNILRAAAEVQCQTVGIEKGALKNAVDGYLEEYRREYRANFHVIELSHNNRAKAQRIAWALEGRAQKGRITLNPGPWVEEFLDEATGFPSPMVHDDLIDALAYIDQMAETSSYSAEDFNDIRAKFMDEEAGY
jgi:hypothetical protein